MTDRHDATLLSADSFWKRSFDQVILDVRSPAEYCHGHIPGAINLPIFDDEQRAEIGTIYKHSGHEAAVLRGLKIIGPKMADIVVEAREISGGSPSVLVHCWRGGQRSHSVAWLLRTAGMQPTVLDGGYKAFRKLAQLIFERPWHLQVISGLTGAGKTRVLHLIRESGEQVVDLEGLANHRGSAFGGIGQQVQPSTEQFENDLFACLDSCQAEERIWVEDEGNRIGTVVVPHLFYQQLRQSPGIFLESSIEARVELLVGDYGDLPIGELESSIVKIRKRLGGQHADEAQSAIGTGNVRRAIEIVLAYYDKTYLNAVNKMPRAPMPHLAIDKLTDAEIVQRMIELSDSVE